VSLDALQGVVDVLGEDDVSVPQGLRQVSAGPRGPAGLQSLEFSLLPSTLLLRGLQLLPQRRQLLLQLLHALLLASRVLRRVVVVAGDGHRVAPGLGRAAHRLLLLHHHGVRGQGQREVDL